MATVLKPVADAIALLDKWEREGDEQEQAETMAVIRETLGEKRIGSKRSMFP
jgi:hypothetical protein